MHAGKLFILLCLPAIGTGVVSGPAYAAAPNEAAARCAALGSADFSRIPDAATQILGARFNEPNGTAAGYCQVSGYVAPSFGFVLHLPTEKWNGKFIEQGCAGLCGDIELFLRDCEEPLRRGYACVISDGGHKSTGSDGKWAYNNPNALSDYFVRAAHLTALAGKAIVEHYYSKAPGKSYFLGCSSGGRQALTAAQAFPWDFDGIVALSPALGVGKGILNLLWGNRALMDKNGGTLLAAADLELLHRAVVMKCDLNDGIEDGSIGDPRACDFEPAELLCPSSQVSRCLTPQQAEAAQKIYRGPVTSRGEQIALPSALRGSELEWSSNFEGSMRRPSLYYTLAAEWMRYIYFEPNPGPAWTPEDFDFDRDYRRFGISETLEPSPDLRRFKQAGGKLIMAAGWNDPMTGALGIVDYYQAAENLMGGRASTEDFFRLYLIPNVGHCGWGGAGAGAGVIDYLSHLEAWVEKSQAPDRLIAARVVNDIRRFYRVTVDPAKVEFTRPVYPYPIGTKYLGHGDPKDASSFGPARSPDSLNLTSR